MSNTTIINPGETGKYIYLAFDGETAFAKRKDELYIPALMEAFNKVIDNLSRYDLIKYLIQGGNDLMNPKTDGGNGRKYADEHLPWFSLEQAETFSDNDLRKALKIMGTYKRRSTVEHMTLIFGIDQTITVEDFNALVQDVAVVLKTKIVALQHLMPPPSDPDCPRFSTFPMGLCSGECSWDWNKVALAQIKVQLNKSVNPYHPDRPDAKTPLSKATAGFKRVWEAHQCGDNEAVINAVWPHTTLCFLLTGLQDLYLEAAKTLQIEDYVVLNELGMSIKTADGGKRRHYVSL